MIRSRFTAVFTAAVLLSSFLFSVAAFGVLLVSDAAAADAPTKLNVFIWSEYIDPEIIKGFEKKFNCKVTVDLYEDNESMMAKLEGGGDALYDIIVPSDYIVPALVSRNLLAPLRMENLPNVKNVEERFLKPPYDKENKFTVPYQWGTVGLYVRKKKDKPIEETWGLLFDPAKAYGKFVLIDSMRENFSAALRYKGHSVNTTDAANLTSVRDLLIDAKKRAVGFESGVGGKNKVLAKGASVAIAYSGDAVRGMAEDPETYYFVPKEGGEIWMDNLAVPAKAPHRDLAEKFINYILEPEVGAQLSNFNQYPTPNKASRAFINSEDLNNPAIYPTPEIMSKLEFLHDLGDSTKLFDEIWTEVKSK